MNDHKVPFISPELFLRRRVAIVGASGNLLETTLRVVNNHVFNNNDISKEGYSNSPPNFVRDLRNSHILYVAPDIGPWHNKETNAHNSNKLFLFDYSSAGNLKNTFKYHEDKNLQVGTIGILLCISAGLKPDLFGFDLQPVARTHYYQERPKDCSVCHNATEEQKLIVRMRDESFLNVIEK